MGCLFESNGQIKQFFFVGMFPLSVLRGCWLFGVVCGSGAVGVLTAVCATALIRSVSHGVVWQRASPAALIRLINFKSANGMTLWLI
jgi:hypothetical protein